MNKSFHSNGKLLLTGEYVVLDGALALAIPTKYGQSLEIEFAEKAEIHWESLDEKEEIWFKESFKLENLQPSNPENKYSQTLSKILQEARNLNPGFLSTNSGIEVRTKLDFPRVWGLGTSSTLINNIAQWASVDAFTLLNKSFGGSGYDIAAAQHNFPILYKLLEDNPHFQKVNLEWDFKESLFFIHLNEKQDSKEGIAHYRKTEIPREIIQEISVIGNQLLQITQLSEFQYLIDLHEEIISKILKLPTIKSRIFQDYPHSIKSLGAWGGDFVLATGTFSEMEYFKNKGFKTIIPFGDMIR
ncbi:GHMP kinase [Aequorivita sp. H23M31]|uniref:GHMP kinase n=1 Tax=Aequorivita ciconiae TaxID=2494375 RepID=A0A410G623_9FLAO|nr:GYDIA family GHMP kinase [Aequorivita sp. H23M31]QAA82726.1 GHMP kinase [Aequorivita sp. H23M31]